MSDRISYEDWVAEVDKLMLDLIGLNHQDVEDYDWWSEWDACNEPVDAFDEWKLKVLGE